MKISIYSTTKMVDLQTDSGIVQARLWEGETESGIPIHCFIALVAPSISKDDMRQEEFRCELEQHDAPSPATKAYPLKMVI